MSEQKGGKSGRGQGKKRKGLRLLKLRLSGRLVAQGRLSTLEEWGALPADYTTGTLTVASGLGCLSAEDGVYGWTVRSSLTL